MHVQWPPWLPLPKVANRQQDTYTTLGTIHLSVELHPGWGLHLTRHIHGHVVLPPVPISCSINLEDVLRLEFGWFVANLVIYALGCV